MIYSLWVLIVTSLACGIIGVFLLLRQLSMISDAIAHSVLLGIVLAFLITRDLDSPLMVIGAALFGVFTVWCVEKLQSTNLIKQDDAVGIVFPLFFSLAVILINTYARNAHLCTDTVIMGEVILTSLNKITIFGITLPKKLVEMSLVLLLNISFIFVFYKELKITSFDSEYANLSGFSFGFLFYALMTLASLTAVTAFDAVGSILVISFFIAPAASAYLFSKRLKVMLFLTSLFGILNSTLGYYLSIHFNVSMSGMVATVGMVNLMLCVLLYPDGIVTVYYKKYKEKKTFLEDLIIFHMGSHMDHAEEQQELGFDSIAIHLKWSSSKLEKNMNRLIDKGIVFREEKQRIYRLSNAGMEYYRNLMEEYGLKNKKAAIPIA